MLKKDFMDLMMRMNGSQNAPFQIALERHIIFRKNGCGKA